MFKLKCLHRELFANRSQKFDSNELVYGRLGLYEEAAYSISGLLRLKAENGKLPNVEKQKFSGIRTVCTTNSSLCPHSP